MNNQQIIIAKLEELKAKYVFNFFEDGDISTHYFKKTDYKIVSGHLYSFHNKVASLTAFFDEEKAQAICKPIVTKLLLKLERGITQNDYYSTLVSYLNSLTEPVYKERNYVTETFSQDNGNDSLHCLKHNVALKIDAILEHINNSRYFPNEAKMLFSISLIKGLLEHRGDIQQLKDIQIPRLQEVKSREFKELDLKNKNIIRFYPIEENDDHFYRNFLSTHFVLKGVAPDLTLIQIADLWKNIPTNALFAYIESGDNQQLNLFQQKYKNTETLINERKRWLSCVKQAVSIPSRKVVLLYPYDSPIGLEEIQDIMGVGEFTVNYDHNELSEYALIIQKIDTENKAKLDIEAIKKRLLPRESNILIKPFYIDIDNYMKDNPQYKKEENSITDIITVRDEHYNELFKLNKSDLHIKQDYRELDGDIVLSLQKYLMVAKPERLKDVKEIKEKSKSIQQNDNDKRKKISESFL